MCGQGNGSYPMEKLYVNGTAFLAERRGDGLHIPDDIKCITKAKLELGLGFSVDTSIESWAQNNGTWDTISNWLDEYGNRINVYNPDMKDSPVKVVRLHNFISIYIFYELVGDVPEKIDGYPTWELVENSFAAWGGLFDNNQTSEKFGNYSKVQVDVHYIYSSGNTLKINFMSGKGRNRTSTNHTKWRIYRLGEIIVYTESFKNWFRFIKTIEHEFGHILGIDDAYGEGYRPEAPETLEVGRSDIMKADDDDEICIISPNDIEMMWEAWIRNRMQCFVDMPWDPADKSEVVRF